MRCVFVGLCTRIVACSQPLGWLRCLIDFTRQLFHHSSRTSLRLHLKATAIAVSIRNAFAVYAVVEIWHAPCLYYLKLTGCYELYKYLFASSCSND